jgi:hypothetical protein
MFSAATKTGSQPAAAVNWIDDVFSTYLYAGNGGAQTITNGIDLAGKGGLLWIKSRTSADASLGHVLADTVRGRGSYLRSQSTNAAATSPAGFDISSFNSDGFTLNDPNGPNNFSLTNASNTYCSWSFRKQPKFFDVVTFTGDGASERQVNHSLGSAPGMVIVKSTSNSANWAVWHRSLGATSNNMYLNLTSASGANADFSPSGSGTMSSTSFCVSSTLGLTNASGQTYVAYLFAHNAGGFGTSGTDNVISCGSFAGASLATVNLGYEPQLVLFKIASASGGWYLADTMRGMSNTDSFLLQPNTSGAEFNLGSTGVIPTATGFNFNGSNFGYTSGQTIIYMAIRRPMKVPTDATTVFSPQTATYSANQVVTTGFPVDMTMIKPRTFSLGTIVYDRLRGIASTNTSPVDPQLFTSDTSAETSGDYINTANNTGYQISPGFSGFSSVNWNFSRRPGFFDVVCYTGTGSTTAITHNLGVVPELVIMKPRSSSGGWSVGNTITSKIMFLQDSGAAFGSYITGSSTEFYNTVYSRDSGETYVAYLFATLAGVSKVGSYTGTGATQTINAGFTGGARFVLIKRTDSTGDWFVWDTARGMVAGTDPRLALNSTAAETNANWVYTTTGGFQIVTTDATVNASGGSYIFLAIA